MPKLSFAIPAETEMPTPTDNMFCCSISEEGGQFPTEIVAPVGDMELTEIEHVRRALAPNWIPPPVGVKIPDRSYPGSFLK